MKMSVAWLVGWSTALGQTEISQQLRWITVKFGTDIHGGILLTLVILYFSSGATIRWTFVQLHHCWLVHFPPGGYTKNQANMY